MSHSTLTPITAFESSVEIDATPAPGAKSKRQHRAKPNATVMEVDATQAPQSPAEQEQVQPKAPPFNEEIAASCRTLLFEHLTGTVGLPAIDAEAAADRAINALRPPSSPVPPTRDNTKLARLITLLRRRQGATIAELVATTGWQAHSVRGALSGTLKKKMGLAVTSEAAEGGRIYRLPSDS
jgi:Protein of unknown function (DUF3489)